MHLNASTLASLAGPSSVDDGTHASASPEACDPAAFPFFGEVHVDEPAREGDCRPSEWLRREARESRLRFIALANFAGCRCGFHLPMAELVVYPDCDDASKAEVNGKAAGKALAAVRQALYTRSLGSAKSSNKWPGAQVLPPPPFVNRLTLDFSLEESGCTPRVKRILYSLQAWQRANLNCSGLSVAVQDWLAEECPDIQTSLLDLGDEHTLVIVGSANEALVREPLRRWPPHLFVCDPWGNLCCPAHEYPDRFREKMFKWHEDGKQVKGADERWTSPIAPEKLCWTDDVRRLTIRLRDRRGQFDDVTFVKGSMAPAPEPGDDSTIRSTTRSTGDPS